MFGAEPEKDEEAKTDHQEQSHRISQDLKIDTALLTEIGKKKYTKTV